MNQGIHGIDLVQWIMGGVDTVCGHVATVAHERIEVEDVATATVRYKNGALGVIEGTTAAWPGAKIRIEISGSGGNVVMEDETIVQWEFAEEQPGDEEIREKYGPREGLTEGVRRMPRPSIPRGTACSLKISAVPSWRKRSPIVSASTDGPRLLLSPASTAARVKGESSRSIDSLPEGSCQPFCGAVQSSSSSVGSTPSCG